MLTRRRASLRMAHSLQVWRERERRWDAWNVHSGLMVERQRERAWVRRHWAIKEWRWWTKVWWQGTTVAAWSAWSGTGTGRSHLEGTKRGWWRHTVWSGTVLRPTEEGWVTAMWSWNTIIALHRLWWGRSLVPAEARRWGYRSAVHKVWWWLLAGSRLSRSLHILSEPVGQILHGRRDVVAEHAWWLLAARRLHRPLLWVAIVANESILTLENLAGDATLTAQEHVEIRAGSPIKVARLDILKGRKDLIIVGPSLERLWASRQRRWRRQS